MSSPSSFPPDSSIDVIVIGGGPAGSTTATLLAQHGRRVLLLERERFPRFHIGESLIPETWWVLQRLNMLDRLRASRFVQKHSVQFVSASGRQSAPFYFADNKPHESSQTWQVVRSEFDRMLLDNARAHGVDAREGVHVLEVLFDGPRAVGVRLQDTDGTRRDLHASVIVDASGQGALLMNRLGLRVWDPLLNKGAIWTYFEGAYRDTGRDAGATMVIQTANRRGWFWYIPLHDDRVSVGVVAPFDYLFKGRDSHEQTYAEEVEACDAVKTRVSRGRRVTGHFVTRDYSYRARQVAGDGWVLVGDAFGFLDPLYSSGVMLALKSGELAADAIHDGLARGDSSAAALGRWGETFSAGVDRMRRLVCEYYEGFNFGRFIRQYPHLRGTVTDLLIGDLFTDRVDTVWEPMASITPADRPPILPWNALVPSAGAAAPDGRRAALHARQAARLSQLIAAIDGASPFYTRKLRDAGVTAANLAARHESSRDPSRDAARDLAGDLERLPFTTKAELVADQAQHGPWGSVLTEPIDAYTRFHQTSSTTGRPLIWIDTAASWQWALDCWKAVFASARVTAADRIFFPFSFGPFLGFWTAFEAGCQIGAHCVPGGGMSSEQRLAMIEAAAPTVVCCTPTYALRLAEAAQDDPSRPPLDTSTVRTIIVAGEPGGSLPAVRRRIEAAWRARVIDHYGLTEVGPVAFECWEAPGGLHVNEEEFIAEVIGPDGRAAAPGAPGELVLTNLGRLAHPVLRYRTGDIVRPSIDPCACGSICLRLDGGVIARADDMVTVRGVNVYPTAIEAIVRANPAIVEFRATVRDAGPMRSLTLEVETAAGGADDVCAGLARALRESFGLSIPVVAVDAGTLPRFTMKARRFIVEPGAGLGA